MNERNILDIKLYLQKEDVQERVRQNMQRGRLEVTVTIGRAARLFGFSENQLRDWEDHGLLNPLRPTGGQRQYPFAELDKLAIIKELIDEGDYAPGSIPADIDKIWASIASEQEDHKSRINGETEHLHIEQRVESAYEVLFWRYYASHVLWLCLLLICEEIPGAPAGLVLPLEKRSAINVHRPEDLHEIGESLIGWLGQSRTFYTFLDQTPSFEYPSDYRILPLQGGEEDAPRDSTLIIVDRRVNSVNLSSTIVETICRLLAPLYKDVQRWQPSFTFGMRDLLDPAIGSSGLNSSDTILTGIANMVIRLGGHTDDGRHRWRFCCILLPVDTIRPLQQRSLIIWAQSKDAPHTVRVTTVSPNEPVIGISLRAFQSGRVIYRSEISTEDYTVTFREPEGSIRSAIAIPIGGEDGQPVAVLYIVSDEAGAFPREDQRVIRIVGRMIEEFLRTYYARGKVTQNLIELIKGPDIVDVLFGDFFSENEFISDVDSLLTRIQTETKEDVGQSAEGIVSFIAIDVDNQSSIANKYGDQITRNLSWEVGQRIQRLLRASFTKYADFKLYHIYADRFYLLLDGVPLELAREKAERLRQGLRGSYRLDALRISVEQPTRPDSMLELPNITVRLGVTSYTYIKLEEVLLRYSATSSVANVRAVIARFLDEALYMGLGVGGNVVISWDPEVHGLVRWSPEI